MKPKCYLARIVTEGMCSGETAPGWVSRHTEHCDACRTESEALQATRSLLREGACERDCPVEWADVRTALREPVPIRRPVWRLAGAAVCAAIAVAAAALWMMTPPAPKHQPTPPRSRVAQVTEPAPDQPKVVRNPEPVPPVALIREPKSVKKATQPRSVKRRTPRHRRLIPPHRLMVQHEKPSEPARKAPDAPRIVAVAPEEHVIGIVGVSVDQGDEHSYVIREVSAVANGESRVVRL